MPPLCGYRGGLTKLSSAPSRVETSIDGPPIRIGTGLQAVKELGGANPFRLVQEAHGVAVRVAKDRQHRLVYSYGGVP
jgi:hypothetical protein